MRTCSRLDVATEERYIMRRPMNEGSMASNAQDSEVANCFAHLLRGPEFSSQEAVAASQFAGNTGFVDVWPFAATCSPLLSTAQEESAAAGG